VLGQAEGGNGPQTVTKYTVPAEEGRVCSRRTAGHHREVGGTCPAVVPRAHGPRARLTGLASCNAHHEAIKAGLVTNTLATVYPRLRDEGKLKVSETTLRRYVAVAPAEQVKAGLVTVLKDDPPPREEAQVDYGRLGMWFDPEVRKSKAARATLSSRRQYQRVKYVGSAKITITSAANRASRSLAAIVSPGLISDSSRYESSASS
jgi:hypothetical protein